MVRFDDDGDPIDTLSSYYGLPNTWVVSFVHDMNASGQMIVTLTVRRNILSPKPGQPSFFYVDYPCIVTLASDLDGDFRVNGSDSGILLGDWNSSGPLLDHQKRSDLNDDGLVQSLDLGVLLGGWSGSEPSDLHNYFPCYSPLQAFKSPGGESVDAPMVLTVEEALALLGWPDQDAFALWGSLASPAELTAILMQVKALIGDEQ